MGNFGLHIKEKEDAISKGFKEHGPFFNCESEQNGTELNGASNGVTKKTRKAPTIKDVTGSSLQYIGTYKQLDNKKQVVALIDDVSELWIPC